MGTRADFYVGTGDKAEWLGSVGWDGYEWDEQPDCALMTATTEGEFIAAVNAIAEEREDWTSPKQGWPWPWENSFRTDRTYAFANGQTESFHWGKKLPENEEDDLVKTCEWPDMRDKKNVTMGPRSGLMVFGLKK